MTPEDEEFEAIAKRQAKKQAEKSFGDGDCDSPSWCKYYGKCHRKSVRAPMLANCIDTTETQKPVAYRVWGRMGGISFRNTKPDKSEYVEWDELYTTPSKREWVGLTDEEIDELYGSPMELEHSGALKWVRVIEAKLKEKNT